MKWLPDESWPSASSSWDCKRTIFFAVYSTSPQRAWRHHLMYHICWGWIKLQVPFSCRTEPTIQFRWTMIGVRLHSSLTEKKCFKAMYFCWLLALYYVQLLMCISHSICWPRPLREAIAPLCAEVTSMLKICTSAYNIQTELRRYVKQRGCIIFCTASKVRTVYKTNTWDEPAVIVGLLNSASNSKDCKWYAAAKHLKSF